MKLKDAYLKRKFENVTTYQFKNEYNEVSILEVEKRKSGYSVEYRSENQNFFSQTDGLKDIKTVSKFIETFKY